MHNFIFGVYPYIALTVMIIASIARCTVSSTRTLD